LRPFVAILQGPGTPWGSRASTTTDARARRVPASRWQVHAVCPRGLPAQARRAASILAAGVLVVEGGCTADDRLVQARGVVRSKVPVPAPVPFPKRFTAEERENTVSKRPVTGDDRILSAWEIELRDE